MGINPFSLQPSRLLANFGWMASAEMLNRATRLITAVVLARMLDPTAFGVAALAIVVHELIRVMTSAGLGARIINATDDDLETVCQTVFRLNLFLGLALAIIQFIVAWAIAAHFEQPVLGWMIATLSISYLIYPFALVQVYRIQRSQNFSFVARATAGQVSADNLLTALFAIAGLGAWSIVLPKLIVGPIWVITFRRIDSWRANWSSRMSDTTQIIRFSVGVLGNEVLTTLRHTADKLVVGHVLGLEVLGFYYFACNAGLGISISIINAFGAVLFSDLSAAWRRGLGFRQHYMRSIATMLAITTPVIAAQTLLAPIYVPVIFGVTWIDTVPILQLLCLSAMTRPAMVGSSQLLRAIGRPDVDLIFSTIFTLLFFLSLMIATPHGLLAVAATIMMLNLIAIPIWFLWTTLNFAIPPRQFSGNFSGGLI